MRVTCAYEGEGLYLGRSGIQVDFIVDGVVPLVLLGLRRCGAGFPVQYIRSVARLPLFSICFCGWGVCSRMPIAYVLISIISPGLSYYVPDCIVLPGGGLVVAHNAPSSKHM